MYDLIVIGGGPAGLAATVYALRKQLNLLLIAQDLGGKTIDRMKLSSMDEYLILNGEEVVNRFVNELSHLGFKHVKDTVERIEAIPDRTAAVEYQAWCRSGATYTARAILVATGVRPQPLEVPGESKFLMRGLAYSAHTYAQLFSNRAVVVIGDSDLALHATAELARLARLVTLVAPTQGQLGGPLGQRLRWTPGVVILEGYTVERVEGFEFARALILNHDGDKHIVPADAILVELGLIPNSTLVADLVERDAQGRILIDAHSRTSAPGIFAAGDVTNVYAEQMLVAIGEGIKAALSAYDYLQNQPIETPARQCNKTDNS